MSDFTVTSAADNHHEAVREQLVADLTVTGLVAGRIYPNKAPQGEAAVGPFIIIRIISDVPGSAIVGAVATRLHSVRVQVDSYAKTYRVAHQVAAAVDQVLAALRISDLSAFREGAVDTYDDEAEVFGVSADYRVFRGP